MKIEEIAELVLDKLKREGCYFEIEANDAKSSIIQHLEKIYKYELECSIMKLELEKASKKIRKQDYSKEYKVVEDRVIKKAELIAITTKKDLQNFI